MRFTIFEIIFSFWNKDFKRIGCAKARLLKIDRVDILSDRSIRSYMFFKTGILKIPQYSQENTCVGVWFSESFLKFFIKKRLQHRYFPVNITKSLRTTFVIENRRLLSTWPYYIFKWYVIPMTWMINELIAFSSCAMS